MHFQEGERFANAPSRSFTKGNIRTPVLTGFLLRRKALRLKLLGFRPKIRMPMGDVLADHHDGILRDRIAANLVGSIGLARQDHRGRIEPQGLTKHHATVRQMAQVLWVGGRPPSTISSSVCTRCAIAGCCANRYHVQLNACAEVSAPAPMNVMTSSRSCRSLMPTPDVSSHAASSNASTSVACPPARCMT